jgi:hypothetical protein
VVVRVERDVSTDYLTRGESIDSAVLTVTFANVVVLRAQLPGWTALVTSEWRVGLGGGTGGAGGTAVTQSPLNVELPACVKFAEMRPEEAS